jgi:hypothetical protein
MDYNENRPRPNLTDVSNLGIKCAKCDAVIDKLPFTPTKKEDGSFGSIYCYECNKERRKDFKRRF